MNILFEGPDGSGKSTLIDQLRQRYYCHIIRTSGPPRSRNDVNEFLGLIATPGTVLKLIDRHPFISDPIYSWLLKRAPAIPNVIIPIPNINLIVYCRPPTDTIKANLMTQEHLPGIIERIDDLITAYDERMSTYPEGLIRRYNYSLENALPSLLYALKGYHLIPFQPEN